MLFEIRHLLSLATDFYKKGFYNDAEKIFVEIKECYPKEPRAYLGIIWCRYASLKDNDILYCSPEAFMEDEFKKALAFTPEEERKKMIAQSREAMCKDLKQRMKIIEEFELRDKQNIAFGKSSDSCVFISYTSKNEQIVDCVRFLLMEKKIPCWMSKYDIPGGSNYAKVIPDVLKKCSGLLLMLTKESQESPMVKREVGLAIKYRKPILPMQSENLELNQEFELYLHSCQIVTVPEIRADAPEFLKILNEIKKW